MIIKNRKAQEMSVGTVILLILGIVILVFLILGFSTGWSKMLPWLSSNNVDAIKNACSVACATGSQYDYCSAMRVLKDEDGKYDPATCDAISKGQVTLKGQAVNKGFGVGDCPSVSC